MPTENTDYRITNERSEITHAILSADTRYKKAQKIFSILTHFTKIKSAKLLDIGTGSGHIAKAFSNYGSKVCSIDPHDLRVEKIGYEFIQMTGTKIPYREQEFDIVISNHVIEHVEDQKEHLDEIYRVLKPGGIFYLATPSKFTFMEPHYRILFLSWFSRKFSAKYLRLVRNKTWDIQPLTSSMIINLAEKRFDVVELSPHIMHQPKKYSLDMMPGLHFIFEKIPFGLWRMMAPFLPTIILILRKQELVTDT